MSLRARLRLPKGPPQGALVLLHGFGTDENDLFDLGDLLDLHRQLLVATPRGPLSMGWGAAWYPTIPASESDPQAPGEPFSAALQALQAWLGELLAQHGLQHRHAVLGGFSQGSVMALAVALSPAAPALGGVLAFSAWLPKAAGYTPDLSRAGGLPVFYSHGTLDNRMPVRWARAARLALETAGAALSYHEFAGGHTIDDQELARAQRWLQRRLQTWQEKGE